MKKLIIILAFLPLGLFGQIDLIQSGGRIISFQGNAVGTDEVLWEPGTGRYDYTSTYLDVMTNGTVAKPSTQAYGVWEMDIYKGGDGTALYIPYISDGTLNTINNYGYVLYFAADESIWIRVSNGGTATLPLRTSSSYISINTWYSIQITRDLSGITLLEIKGGAFGSSYVPVGSIITGSNPFTDNTYTTSNYNVLDLDISDRYSDDLITEEVGVYYNTTTLDQYLSSLVTQYTATPPTSNLTLNMLGNRFPIPNDGASNTYILQLETIFTNAGYTFTALINS